MEVKTYPVLRPAFLVNIIATEWSIHVNEQDLREPKPETVQNIYGAILADLLSLDVRSFDRDGPLAAAGTENSEHHYEATRLQMLLYHMARVAKVCKVQTFTMRDLTRPTGQRTIRVLSAVCNFRAFTDMDERRTFLVDLQDQARNRQMRVEEEMGEVQDAEEELAGLKAGLERDKPELAQIKETIEKNKVQMKEDLTSVDEMLKQVQALKLEKRDLKSRVEELNIELSDIHRSNINDKSRIMQSPDRVRRKIADMNASTEQLKPQIAQTDALRAQAMAKDGVFRNLILDLKEVLRDLENLKGDLKSLEELKVQHAERLGSKSQREAHYKILTSQLTQADRQRLRAEEKLSEIRVAHQQKQEAARRKHEVLQERYRKLLGERGERDLDDTSKKEGMEGLVGEREALIDEEQADIDALYEEYQNIDEVIQSYMHEMDRNLSLNLSSTKHRSKHPRRDGDDPRKSTKRRKKSRAGGGSRGGSRAASADVDRGHDGRSSP